MFTSKKLTRTVTIHENQRCWIGRGFSSGGLLPNDRGPYAFADGSQSWKTRVEAEDELLGIGWKYRSSAAAAAAAIRMDASSSPSCKTKSTDAKHENSRQPSQDQAENYPAASARTDHGAHHASGILDQGDDHDHDDDESDGWYYARDFTMSAIRDAKRIRGPLHWVRFRKWTTPIMEFDPDVFCHPREIYLQCDHYGDSQAVQELAKLLLEALTYMCLIHENGSINNQSNNHKQAPMLKEANIQRRKIDLLVFLIHYQSNHVDTTEPDAFRELQHLHHDIQNFADQEQKNVGLVSSLFSSSFPSFSNRTTEIKGFQEIYCAYVNAGQFFNESERYAIASLLIKKLDTHFQLHCSKIDCGDACDYQWVPCPNQDCPAMMSRMYLSAHEQECPFQPITCECGDTFPRMKQATHLTDVCPLRDATCPFARIGCSKIVPARDIPSHIDKDTSTHLLLAFHRMMEYEATIRMIHERVNELEKENRELKKIILTEKTVADRTYKQVDQKLTSLKTRVDGVEKIHQKEFKRIRDQQRDLEVKIIR